MTASFVRFAERPVRSTASFVRFAERPVRKTGALIRFAERLIRIAAVSRLSSQSISLRGKLCFDQIAEAGVLPLEAVSPSLRLSKNVKVSQFSVREADFH